MKHNKETKVNSRWKQWLKSPNVLSYLALVVFFIAAVFLLFNRFINKAKLGRESRVSSFEAAAPPVVEAAPVVPPVVEAAPVVPPVVEAAPTPLENKVTLQDTRLANVESTVNTLVGALQISRQLIIFDMLKEILDGHIPLETLTLYLQRHAEPWTTDILTTLSSVQGSMTCDQLEMLLVLPIPPESTSLWDRLKKAVTSVVKIRKLSGNFATLQAALRTRNIQESLAAFDKLRPEEQAQLASWKQGAQDRWALENLKQKMILNLSGS